MIRKIGDRILSIRSESYEAARSRFDEILRTKLGRAPKGAMTPSSMVFGELVSSRDHGQIAGADPRDVRKISASSAGAIDRALRGTQMAGLGEAFKRAESQYGINAWVLAGIASHESSFGTSPIARDKRNLFGFQAYDSSPYRSARSFHSFEEGIDHVASYLSRAYLTPGGTYFNGFSIDDIGRRYATDPAWASKVKTHIHALISRDD